MYLNFNITFKGKKREPILIITTNNNNNNNDDANISISVLPIPIMLHHGCIIFLQNMEIK